MNRCMHRATNAYRMHIVRAIHKFMHFQNVSSCFAGFKWHSGKKHPLVPGRKKIHVRVTGELKLTLTLIISSSVTDTRHRYVWSLLHVLYANISKLCCTTLELDSYFEIGFQFMISNLHCTCVYQYSIHSVHTSYNPIWNLVDIKTRQPDINWTDPICSSRHTDVKTDLTTIFTTS